MPDKIRKITALGQAIWLDFISRDLLESGDLRALIAEGLAGMTSNPTIFCKAIAGSDDYDAQIRELARAGKSTGEIYEALAIRDISDAADQLRGVYNETGGRDGYVSIEVNPRLAQDTDGTIAEGRRLFQAIDRPNVMIKVPATDAGLPAIRTLIGAGINVNVTLIFAIDVYERVMAAYVDGLNELRERGKALRNVASVASFFVSRVDSLVDKLLHEEEAAGAKGLDTLFGQAAIANARIAYDRYKHVFEGEPFAKLRAADGRPQRPLWASTSTKNPKYASTKYVDTLIGPNTVNTVPPNTLDAIREHATPARTIDLDVADAYGTIERLQAAGIDMRAVTDQLLREGVKAFADSFTELEEALEQKRMKYAG